MCFSSYLLETLLADSFHHDNGGETSVLTSVTRHEIPEDCILSVQNNLELFLSEVELMRAPVGGRTINSCEGVDMSAI
jgi:hypothetical protein